MATLLLVRDDAWSMWSASAPSPSSMQAGSVRSQGEALVGHECGRMAIRVALMLPYLEHQEPLVAKIAYGELAAAPYAELQTGETAPRRTCDPPLARRSGAPARRPLYFLLLGMPATRGTPQPSRNNLRLMEGGRRDESGSMIAADLQLRGPSRMAWVDAKYMGDRLRSTRSWKRRCWRLSVLRKRENDAIPRERVIQSYLMFIREHQELAGFVAWDLAAWHYWARRPYTWR